MSSADIAIEIEAELIEKLAAERANVEKLRDAAALTLAQFASVNMTLDAVRKAFVQAAPKEDGE